MKETMKRALIWMVSDHRSCHGLDNTTISWWICAQDEIVLVLSLAAASVCQSVSESEGMYDFSWVQKLGFAQIMTRQSLAIVCRIHDVAGWTMYLDKVHCRIIYIYIYVFLDHDKHCCVERRLETTSSHRARNLSSRTKKPPSPQTIENHQTTFFRLASGLRNSRSATCIGIVSPLLLVSSLPGDVP